MNHGFLISPLLNTVITFQALPANISWLFVVSFDTCCILLRKGPKGPPRVPPMVPQGSSKGFLKGPPRVTKGPQGCFNKPVQQDVFGAVKPKKIDQKHCHAPGEHCSWKGGHFSSPRAESKLSPRWQAAQDHPRAFGDHCCESLNLWELLTSCPGQASQAVCSAHYDKKCAPSAKGGISSLSSLILGSAKFAVYLPHSHAPFSLSQSVNSWFLLLDSTFFFRKFPSDLPKIVFGSAEGSTILVFLPGIAEISSLWQAGWEPLVVFSSFSNE